MRRKNTRARSCATYLLRYTRRNRMLILLAGLFLLGVLSATLLFDSTEPEIREPLFRLADSFARKKLSQEFRANFVSAFSASMLFVAALFLCGFCAVAQPAVIAIPLFRGLGIGFSMASLYAYHGSEAFGFAAIHMASVLLSAMAMLLCCIEALRFSVSLLGAVRSGERAVIYPVRRYLAKFLAAALICAAAAALEAILYAMFANIVVFG